MFHAEPQSQSKSRKGSNSNKRKADAIVSEVSEVVEVEELDSNVVGTSSVTVTVTVTAPESSISPGVKEQLSESNANSESGAGASGLVGPSGDLTKVRVPADQRNEEQDDQGEAVAAEQTMTAATVSNSAQISGDWTRLQNEIQSKLQDSLEKLPSNLSDAEKETMRKSISENLSKDLVSLVQSHVPPTAPAPAEDPTAPPAETALICSVAEVEATAAADTRSDPVDATMTDKANEARTAASRENVWALRVEELKAFMAATGHSSVSKTFKPSPPLGRVS